MKRKLILAAILTMALLTLAPISGNACTVKTNIGYLQEEDPDTAVLVKVLKKDQKKKAISIPRQVKVDGYNVRIIGIKKNAFKGCKKLKKIKVYRDCFNIPKSIKKKYKVIYRR